MLYFILEMSTCKEMKFIKKCLGTKVFLSPLSSLLLRENKDIIESIDKGKLIEK